MSAIVVGAHGFPYRTAREVSLKNSAHNGGVSCWLRGHAHAQPTQEGGHGFLCSAGVVDSSLQFAELHICKSDEDMVFGGEIIEESAFADVRGIGDVLYGGFRETFLGEKIEGGAEKTFSSFNAATVAATRRSRGRCNQGGLIKGMDCDFPQYMTIGHTRGKVQETLRCGSSTRSARLLGLNGNGYYFNELGSDKFLGDLRFRYETIVCAAGGTRTAPLVMMSSACTCLL